MDSFRDIIQPIHYRFHDEHAPIKTTTEFGFPVRVQPVQQVNGDTDRVFCFNVCSTGSAVFFRSVG